MWQRNYDGSPSLYLIPTPIGNMEDMTYRSVKILNEVEVVFSEDTRVTQNLLRYFDIKKKLSEFVKLFQVRKIALIQK